MPAALLDTNAVSDLMRDDPKVKARVGSGTFSAFVRSS